MDYIKIGEFLKSLRKAKGLTQQEVADELFVSQKTISKWERGDGVPDITIVGSVASFYGVTVDELLNGERGKPNQSEYTIRAKEGEKLKLVKRKLTNSLNIFNISALITGVVFLLLDCFLGIYVDELVGVILGGVGLALALIVFIIGYYLAKESLDNNDAGLPDSDNDKLRTLLSKKLSFFNNSFFAILLASIILYSVFSFAGGIYGTSFSYERIFVFVVFNFVFLYFYFFIRKLILNQELRNKRYVANGLFIPAIFYSIIAILSLIIITIDDGKYPVSLIFNYSYGFFMLFLSDELEIVLTLSVIGIVSIIATACSFKIRKIWLLLITLPIGIASTALYVLARPYYGINVSVIGVIALIFAIALISSVLVLEYKAKKNNELLVVKDTKEHVYQNKIAKITFIALDSLGLITGSIIMLLAASLYENKVSYIMAAIGFLLGSVLIALAHLIAKLILKKDNNISEPDKNDMYFNLRRNYIWILDLFVVLAVVVGLIIAILYKPYYESYEAIGAIQLRIVFIVVLATIYVLMRQLIFIKREVSHKSINRALSSSIALMSILMIASFLQIKFYWDLEAPLDLEYRYLGIILFTFSNDTITYQIVAISIASLAAIGIIISASFNKLIPIYPLAIIGIAIEVISSIDFNSSSHLFNSFGIQMSYIGLAELIVVLILTTIVITNYISHKIRNK